MFRLGLAGQKRFSNSTSSKKRPRSEWSEGITLFSYNRIDIGIFLCFLELCLMQSGISYERELFTDTAENNCEEVLTAKYKLI